MAAKQSTAQKRGQQRQTPQNGRSNGEAPTGNLVEAMAYEDAIANEAAGVRGEAKKLTPELFMQLRPLLRRSIPSAYIESIPALDKGKPYESTGVRSVQVQIDRMDNVLTPMWWDYGEPEYSSDGKVCKVTITVGIEDRPLVRSSFGGVQAGSGEGNIRKGAFTNAAKLAIARIGPGWEIYVGVPDLDPDVNRQVADAQGRAEQPAAVKTISAEDAARLRDIFDRVGIDPKKLKVKLGSLGVSGKTVNTALASLTPKQAEDIEQWLSDQADAGDEGGEAAQPELEDGGRS